MKFKLITEADIVKRENSLPVNDEDSLNKQIMTKIFTLAKALADEFGWDYRLIAKDIINDLELINGKDITSLVNSPNPIDAMTYAMASEARQAGVNSNDALHFLLDMDVGEAVQQFKSFMNRNGGRMLRGGQPNMLPFGRRGQLAIHESLNYFRNKK